MLQASRFRSIYFNEGELLTFARSLRESKTVRVTVLVGFSADHNTLPKAASRD